MVLLALAALSPASPASEDRGWDTEISCCFLWSDFQKGGEYATASAITLGGEEAVAELKLIAPDGAILGFDEKTGLYRRPDPKAGAYVRVTVGGIDLVTAGPDWDNESERVLVFFPRAGEYRLEVIGVRDGRYSLGITPLGQASGHIFGTGLVPIKAGEIHTYVFPGEFENLFLGPKPFYLKRIDR